MRDSKIGGKAVRSNAEFRENAEMGRLSEMSENMEFRRELRRESREILESRGESSRNAEFQEIR